jgi:hypothetical protein
MSFAEIAAYKNELIAKILATNDFDKLKEVGNVLEDNPIIYNPNIGQVEEALVPYVKPIRKHLDIEALAKEQGWKGFKVDEFEVLIKELQDEIEEPLEELLEMLTP